MGSSTIALDDRRSQNSSLVRLSIHWISVYYPSHWNRGTKTNKDQVHWSMWNEIFDHWRKSVELEGCEQKRVVSMEFNCRRSTMNERCVEVCWWARKSVKRLSLNKNKSREWTRKMDRRETPFPSSPLRSSETDSSSMTMCHFLLRPKVLRLTEKKEKEQRREGQWRIRSVDRNWDQCLTFAIVSRKRNLLQHETVSKWVRRRTSSMNKDRAGANGEESPQQWQFFDFSQRNWKKNVAFYDFSSDFNGLPPPNLVNLPKLDDPPQKKIGASRQPWRRKIFSHWEEPIRIENLLNTPKKNDWQKWCKIRRPTLVLAMANWHLHIFVESYE